jgi:CheY-like chemotaxis protein
MAGEEVHVDGDGERLEQVVASLLIHAASYTPPGDKIRVGVKQHGSEAILTVMDSGVGIEAERLASLFEPFPAADPDMGREQRSGLHIGLARAREIVELHGGQIEVRSEGRGKGSELIVRLPALAPAQDPALGTDSERSRHAHVLVVAHDPDAAHALAILLDVLGHDVAVAHDGDAALRAARRTRPELVLIDIDQAAVDGCELARRIRASGYMDAVALVALSAQEKLEERQRAIDAGFCCVLSQPVELEGLRAVLRQLPERSPA